MREEMEGINLKIACLNHPPYVVVNETEQGRWELSGGIDAFVIKLLQQKYCFKYEIIVPPDKNWGKLLDDRWTGITGMVNRNEVDLGIANLMITEKKYDAVAFSVPYSVDGFAMVSLAPRTSENTGAVLQPFQTEVWCAIFASVLIISCLLSVMQKLQSCYRMTPILTWRNTLWNVFATLCQEG
ncbi:glutamate receptor ionotropic, delta-2-like isoform X2 [Stegodyphus dumicola]|uniref:glutamate receptor ionotropic, delta-2-like isoform X2 n=1 Tax=Stegodyphus dumicola TaxID=202533 RepID=UPI0015B0244A|nr:glutamate receptor ionotropic, delta-2-like isoform X2 [Stegodyphus dumicola]